VTTLTAFPADDVAEQPARSTTTQASLEFLGAQGVDPSSVRMLVRVLADEPGLNAVRNWRAHEARPHRDRIQVPNQPARRQAAASADPTRSPGL
jgi:hypothetical protein